MQVKILGAINTRSKQDTKVVLQAFVHQRNPMIRSLLDFTAIRRRCGIEFLPSGPSHSGLHGYKTGPCMLFSSLKDPVKDFMGCGCGNRQKLYFQWQIQKFPERSDRRNCRKSAPPPPPPPNTPLQALCETICIEFSSSIHKNACDI